LSKHLERAAEYRAQATALLQMSEREIDGTQKSVWLDMAALYQKMAHQLEELNRLDQQQKSEDD
jgi:hypothetical protein